MAWTGSRLQRYRYAAARQLAYLSRSFSCRSCRWARSGTTSGGCRDSTSTLFVAGRIGKYRSTSSCAAGGRSRRSLSHSSGACNRLGTMNTLMLPWLVAGVERTWASITPLTLSTLSRSCVVSTQTPPILRDASDRPQKRMPFSNRCTRSRVRYHQRLPQAPRKALCVSRGSRYRVQTIGPERYSSPTPWIPVSCPLLSSTRISVPDRARKTEGPGVWGME
mmetsp:Transcript_92942/g.161062  ORF Transcript_92942/g.161062 Transcript_92942/m.161062 type:complete len:221 (+) Transcript_92942:416-1078(+)